MPYVSQLRTPNGQLAGNTDRVMLLSEWSDVLQKDPAYRRESNEFIAAGMGKPSFPAHPDLLESIIYSLSSLRDASVVARALLDNDSMSPEQIRTTIARKPAVIGYENPQGKFSARKEAASALSTWYGVEIKPENILFTTGGAGGLFDVFTMLNKRNPGGRVITPFPHYSLYSSINYGMNNLFPIHVMQEKGYKLNAKVLAKSIQEAQEAAKKDGKSISAFLFCDPNNPLGTVVSKEEWKEIAKVLKSVSKVPIIFDGAYAEMVFDPKNRTSLLEVADDELKKRIILLRSGTKGLSVPGLRMAVTITFDEEIMTRLKQTNIDTGGHPTTVTQDAFAKMLHVLNQPNELEYFVNHYKPQVELVYKQLQEMGANLPDTDYKPEATFYVVGDFSDLLGTELHPDAQRAVGSKTHITNDEDICYDLLFRNRVMIAPLSYYGDNGVKQGYMRITCSGGDKELNRLMEILAERLYTARLQKIFLVNNEIQELLVQFEGTAVPQNEIFSIKEKIEGLLKTEYSQLDKNAKALKAKEVLTELQEIKETVDKLLVVNNPTFASARKAERDKTSYYLQSKCFTRTMRQTLQKEWKNFVDETVPLPASLKEPLYHATPRQRMETKGWQEHLNSAPNPLALGPSIK